MRRCWLINTERLFGQVIPGHAISPSTTAAAQRFERACAALAGQQIGIAHFGEERAGFPDIPEIVLAHVPGLNRQVTAGEDLPTMRDETNACPRQAAFGRGVHLPVRMTMQLPVMAGG